MNGINFKCIPPLNNFLIIGKLLSESAINIIIITLQY